MSSLFLSGIRELSVLRLAVSPLGTLIGFGTGIAILLIIVLVILNDTRRQVGQANETVDKLRRQNNKLYELASPKVQAAAATTADSPTFLDTVPGAAELPQGELIAVISGAIAAYQSEAAAGATSTSRGPANVTQTNWDSATTAGFRIRRIRRVS